MADIFKAMMRDLIYNGKQLAFLLGIAVGATLLVCGPLWGLVWLLNGSAR